MRTPPPLLVRQTQRMFALNLVLAAALAAPAIAAELKPETVQAFDRYIQTTEARIETQARNGPFLWVDRSPERLAVVRKGQIAIDPWTAKGETEVKGGLIHHWVGAVFIDGATIAKTLAMVQDYDHHKDVYTPQVIDSRLRSRNGNDFKIHLRLLKKKVITVVLNTEHDARFFPLDATRWHSRSYSTRIAEVENAGQRNEREKPVGNDNGFLWRLYSYWRFQERDGGVYVECEAISLTRGVPTGLGWLIEPIIRSLPRESLENTLRATRDGVKRS